MRQFVSAGFSWSLAFKLTAPLLASCATQVIADGCECECDDGVIPNLATATWEFTETNSGICDILEDINSSNETTLHISANVCWPGCSATASGILVKTGTTCCEDGNNVICDVSDAFAVNVAANLYLDSSGDINYWRVQAYGEWNIHPNGDVVSVQSGVPNAHYNDAVVTRIDCTGVSFTWEEEDAGDIRTISLSFSVEGSGCGDAATNNNDDCADPKVENESPGNDPPEPPDPPEDDPDPIGGWGGLYPSDDPGCGSGSDESDSPVALLDGHKVERTTDLTVRLPGRDFGLVREYSSDTNLYPSQGTQYYWNGKYDSVRPGEAGAQWSINQFSTIGNDVGPDSSYLFLYGESSQSKQRFVRLLGTDILVASGGGNRYVERGETSSIAGLTLSADADIWRVRVPGGGEKRYIARSDSYPTTPEPLDVEDLVGRLIEEVDAYENVWQYEWISLGAVTTGNGENLRVGTIHMKDSTGVELARVRFEWNGQAGTSFSGVSLSNSTDKHYYGRLARAVVERPTGPTTWVVTDEVRYLYLEDLALTDDTFAGAYGVSASLRNLYDASPGDLCEVIVSQLMDGDLDANSQPDFHEQITQYRYYASNNSFGYEINYGGSILDDAEQWAFAGDKHQLLAVIYPSQIEFYADRVWRAADEIRGDTTAINDLMQSHTSGDPATDLFAAFYASGGAFASPREAAERLRWIGLSDDFSDMHDQSPAILMANSDWSSLLDLTGKVMRYYTSDDAQHGETGRVRTQLISTSASGCGCPGGSSAGFFGLGRRLDYQYTRYKFDEDLPRPATLSPGFNDRTDGYTCAIVESFPSSTSPLSYEAYRVESHDYYWASNFEVGEVLQTGSAHSNKRAATRGIYRLAKAISEADPAWDFDPYSTTGPVLSSGKTWASVPLYDLSTEPTSGQFTNYRKMIGVLSPEAVEESTTGYIPVSDHGSTVTAPTIPQASPGGLVLHFEYDDGYLSATKDSVGTTGVKTTKSERSRGTVRPDLVDSVQRPTGEGVTETSSMAYGYHDSTNINDPDGAIVAWIKHSRLAENEAQNGPSDPVSYHTWTMLDRKGQTRWSLDEMGTLTYYEYAETTGALVLLVRDADPAGAYVDASASIATAFPGLTGDPAWSLPTRSDYNELTEAYEHDLLGRTVRMTDSSGVSSYTRRVLEWSDVVSADGVLVTRGVPFRATASLPHRLSNGSFSSPIRMSWTNANGQEVRTSGFIAEASGSSYNPVIGVYELGSEVLRSDTERLANGLTARTRQWHSVTDDMQLLTAGEIASSSYVSLTEYDAQGRMFRSTDLEGGISETIYDLLGRPVTQSIGTTADEAVLVARSYYDHVLDVTENPLQGIGNGYLTLTEQLDGETVRTTQYWYDYRGQTVAQLNPLAPHTRYRYDNLGRVVSEAHFISDDGYDDGSLVALPDPDTASLDRSTYSQTLYNNRGMVYRTRMAVDPTNGTDPEFLESNQWFDARGATIAAWSPNGPGVKTVYDPLGRTAVAYVTDRFDDAKPGTAGNFAHASSVADDRVIEQTEYAYVAAGEPGAGAAELITHRMRLHDSTDDDALVGSNSIATYTLYEFDDASRAVRTRAYGTNDTTDNEFVKNTAAPSRPSVTGTAADAGSLMSEVFFDPWGRTVLSVSPGGKHTLSVLDALSRQIAVIEGQTEVTAEHIEPGTGTWTVDWAAAYSGGGGAGPDDADRVTTFFYDGLSNVLNRTAHFGNGSKQETLYVYGVTAVSPSGPTDSLVSSSSLLHKVHYPNESTGTADTSAAYTVTYGYNGLGELRGVTDQNGTTHAYTRDLLGRITRDEVTAVGTNIDDRIVAITTAYDAHGRVEEVLSLDDMDDALNGIAFGYTRLHQIETLAQNASGVPGAIGTGTVTYAYANAEAVSDGTGNYSRVASVTYPNEAGETYPTVEYDYGSAGSIDDRLGRTAGMDVPGWTSGTKELVNYTYLGASTPVQVEYASTLEGLALDMTKSRGGDDGATTGTYHGFDRFGRVVHHAWVTDGFAPRGGSFPDTPNRTPMFARAYEYDMDSNRVRDYDARPGYDDGLGVSTIRQDRDWQYVYDDLDRLGTAYRGRQGSGGFTNAADSLKWDLDILGNWKSVWTDIDNDGLFEDAVSEREERDHNMANEITSQGISDGVTSLIVAIPTYDDAGNYRQNRPSGSSRLVYTHDAWNRLVKVVRSSGSHTVLENEFNGLNWRTKRRMDLSQGAYDGVDEARTYYYSANWQILEEHIDTDLDDDTHRIGQQFWGVRYIDDAVARRVDRDGNGFSGDAADNFYYLTDVMFSVRTLVDSNGLLHTRLDYTPYGAAMHGKAADINGDGVVNFTDVTAFIAAFNSGTPLVPGDTGYDPDADLSADGIANIFTVDYNPFLSRYNISSPIFNAGWIDNPSDPNGPDNSIGYDGYVFDLAGATEATSTGLYMVRHRVYDPKLGRWLQRDPVGYIDGSSMLEAVRSGPVTGLDPTGTKRLVAVIHGQNFFGIDLGSARNAMKDIYDDVAAKDDNKVKMFGPDADFWGSAGRWIRSQYERECKKTCRKPSITIIGHSNGGDAARKIANELVRQGYDIAYVATIDPVGKPFHNPGGIYHLDRSKIDFAENWHQRSSDFQIAGFKLWGYTIYSAANYEMKYDIAGLGQYGQAVGPHMWIIEDARRSIVSRVNNHVPLDEGECEE